MQNFQFDEYWDIFKKLWYEKFAFDILRDIEVERPTLEKDIEETSSPHWIW